MTDLNVMMREQARNGLQVQLDAAVTNGDAEAARKIAADMEKLAVSTAPKAPPFGGPEVYAVLDAKAPWYGTDPKKSAKAEEFGKSMKLSKFPTAEAFADAIIKAVDEEFKIADPEPEPEGDEDPEVEEGDEPKGKTEPKKPKRSDGPGDGDANVRGSVRRTGPWTKLSDAPADIQKEIRRQADKFVPEKLGPETA